MKKQDFYFDLPQELIAQYPLANRSDSRLLTYAASQGTYGHHHFRDLDSFLQPGDLLVMNDSKVMPARLFGEKTSGGKVQLLVERIKDAHCFLAHIKASKALKAGGKIMLDKGLFLEVLGREEDLFLCRASQPILPLLQDLGHMPLPPYITRQDEKEDSERYQTVYAQQLGSVAAPTAGLHFDDLVLSRLKARGVNIAYTTLHVGAGTFRPVRSEFIQDHTMHSEWYTISADLVQAVANTKAAGKRVIAVGTTALRSLESAASKEGELRAGNGETSIFIYPGYQFSVCDGLLTNFHLPESTLLILVSAFIGHKQAMALYQEAIAKKYRFFSYGDTSLLFAEEKHVAV